jgi:NO-binding membrane sensor protein with MHYT domain
VAQIHHLTYGAVNPVVAYLIAFVGSLLGLACTTRARAARHRRRRTRWLVLAAITIGGAAVWLMHFTAMFGFDVPDSPVRTPGEARVEGLSPSLLIVPITVLAAVTLIGVAFSALQAMTEEEFADDRWPASRSSGRPAGAVMRQQRGTLGM